ncbi:MAG: hypothetical protein IK093_16665 [Ruminiclostridium sp.]|nr:hypothetical protein [Ruminiclostridium sp.]
MALNKSTAKDGIKEETYVDEKELAIAQEEAEKSENTYIIHFKKPILYNNENIETLEFDFDILTGNDGLKIENELQSIGRPAIVPAFSGEYLIRMACRACTNKRIGVDIFTNMRLSDYNRIRSAARSFLLKSE